MLSQGVSRFESVTPVKYQTGTPINKSIAIKPGNQLRFRVLIPIPRALFNQILILVFYNIKAGAGTGKVSLSHFNLIYLKLGYVEIAVDNNNDNYRQEPEPALALTQEHKLLLLFHFRSETL